MSNSVSMVEQRAKALDEARRIRLLKAEEIDTAKYLKANDVTHKVHEAEVWLDEMQSELGQPVKKDEGVTMPWPKTHNSFKFRPGEVTLYGHGKPSVKPAFYASDLMRIIAFEALVVQVVAFDMAAGKRPSEQDRQRLIVAYQRIDEAMRYANV